jgi:hypothetical protein
LVFEGGGVKGNAYEGAMKFLERKAILPNIERVAAQPRVSRATAADRER